ncbi:MAG: hypothetical protein L0Z50_21640, partial [Verrucomicrobiales bacterium]|nr:hypothetical protein [Verrucomicrobiales bacterium]
NFVGIPKKKAVFDKVADKVCDKGFARNGFSDRLKLQTTKLPRPKAARNRKTAFANGAVDVISAG